MASVLIFMSGSRSSFRQPCAFAVAPQSSIFTPRFFVEVARRDVATRIVRRVVQSHMPRIRMEAAMISEETAMSFLIGFM